MPGKFGEDANLDAVGVIGTAVQILCEKPFAFGVLEKVGQHVVEVLLRHLAVAVPPHAVAREIVDDSMLVLGRAAGVMASEGAECATGDNRGLARADGVLVERRLRHVPVNFGEIFEAEFIGTISAVPHTLFLPAIPPTLGRLNKSLEALLGPAAAHQYIRSAKGARP